MYNRATTLFHSQRIHGRSQDHMIDLVIPQLEKTGYGNNGIPRWEDNVGSVFESDTPAPKLAEQIPQRSTLQGSSRTQPQLVKINHSVPNQNRRNPMNKKVGMWLDRGKAVIVSIENKMEGKRIITSDMKNYVLHSTVVPGDGAPENVRDRRYWNHLGEYYGRIIAHIRDAAEIQIFGPAEAKYELQKHLENEGLAGHIVSLEDAGRLTDLQIATKVQKRFPIRPRFDLSPE